MTNKVPQQLHQAQRYIDQQLEQVRNDMFVETLTENHLHSNRDYTHELQALHTLAQSVALVEAVDTLNNHLPKDLSYYQHLGRGTADLLNNYQQQLNQNHPEQEK